MKRKVSFIKHSLVMLLLGGTLSACSKSSIELPKVTAESHYDCTDYNFALDSNDIRESSAIFTVTANQINRSYTGETVIEKYYKSIRNPDGKYYSEFRGATQKSCNENPSLNMIEAFEKSLLHVWNVNKVNPEAAICWSINEGVLKPAEVVDKLMEKKWRPYRDNTKLVYESNEYGEKYISKQLVEFCNENQNVYLEHALRRSVEPVATQLKAEADKKKQDERNRIYKKEQQEKTQENLKNYTKSVFDEDSINNNKISLREQVNLIEEDKKNSDKYLVGLRLSILDLAETFPDYKIEGIKNLPDEKLIALASDYSSTHSSYSSLKEFSIVEEIESPIVKSLRKKFAAKTELAAKCTEHQECEAEIEMKAAKSALSSAFRCDYGTFKGKDLSYETCFNSADHYYDYNLVEKYISILHWSSKELENEKRRRLQKYNDEHYGKLNSCKQEAVRKGYRGEEYDQYVTGTCEPRMAAEKFKLLENIEIEEKSTKKELEQWREKKLELEKVQI